MAKTQLSITEAAALVGVNRSYIQAEIDKGRLKSEKVGRQHVIQRADLEAWLTANERPTRRRKTKIEPE